MEENLSLNFLEEIIEDGLNKGTYKSILTRFPPEPNGYLHIGHAKSICLNFGLAKKYGGKTNLRFDDTNPVKEDTEYVDSIQQDIRWLGFDWAAVYYASDYFEQLYEWAVVLIKKGLAYVDDQTQEEIRLGRGTVTEPGKNSPWRDRSIEENLDLFERMRNGEFADGEKVLRAKIDMAHPNMQLRDPSCTASCTPTITARATNGASTPCTTTPTGRATLSSISPTAFAPLSSTSTVRSTTGLSSSWASSPATNTSLHASTSTTR